MQNTALDRDTQSLVTSLPYADSQLRTVTWQPRKPSRGCPLCSHHRKMFDFDKEGLIYYMFRKLTEGTSMRGTGTAGEESAAKEGRNERPPRDRPVMGRWIVRTAKVLRLCAATAALWLLLCLPQTAAAEDPVHFDDDNLKSAVEGALGKTNPTPTDMLALTSLDARWRNIGDLTGLEYATELTWLVVERNPIGDFAPLAGLTKLTWLDLEETGISDLAPLAGLTNLTWLDLETNQISDVAPLAGLTKLTWLDLQMNQISDLAPLAGLTNLTVLTLSGNQISDISLLAGRTNLVRLWLEENPLNAAACAVYLPQILANNPGIELLYDGCRCMLMVFATGAGSVTDPGEDSFEYECGAVVSVVAVPDNGGAFLGWTGTAVDAGKVADPGSAATTVRVDGSYTLQANFEGGSAEYKLTVSAGEGGSVTAPGVGVFTSNSAKTVSLAASAHTGYRFSRWTGTAVSAGKVASPTSASTTVTVDGNYSVRAEFVRSGSFSVRVLAPNGGESLAAGGTFPIRWTTQGDPRTVSVELTVDGGGFWTRISFSSAGAGGYDWAVPAVDSDRCLIRVAAEDNAGIADTSDAFFSIHRAPGHIWHVDAAAAPGGDGTSWATAFIHLQDGLASAAGGDSIWVAEGPYWPDLGGGQVAGDRGATFRLQKGVVICGGFPTGGGTWEQRNPFRHQSLLSGDIGKVNVAGDNSFHVVTASGTDRTAILDGCTITAGFANGPEPQDRGAGLYNRNGHPQVRNCTFLGNTALLGNGGGACNIESKATFTNCVFTGNTAGNCGGGMYNEGGAVQIVNCTFAANQGLWRAGGVFCAAGTTSLANCILWGNGRQYKMSYDQLAQTGGDPPPTIDYCCIQGWNGAFGGEGNWGSDPLFVDADGPDDIAGTLDDDLRLSASSPAVDAGNNAGVASATTTDLQGQPRIAGGAVDLGAYEYKAE
jgi:hypothetical protein